MMVMAYHMKISKIIGNLKKGGWNENK